MTTGDLAGLVQQWRSLYEIRKEVELAAEEVSKAEKECEAQILNRLDVAGQKGATFAGIGTVTKAARKTVFLVDQEAACRFMLAEMSQAASAGQPLNNALYMQARASQNKLLEMAEARLRSSGSLVTNDNLNLILKPAGFELAIKDTLHFAKAKNGGS
jgi:hypothetical protein